MCTSLEIASTHKIVINKHGDAWLTGMHDVIIANVVEELLHSLQKIDTHREDNENTYILT